MSIEDYFDDVVVWTSNFLLSSYMTKKSYKAKNIDYLDHCRLCYVYKWYCVQVIRSVLFNRLSLL